MAPEIDIEAVMIPPMLIQPHVENAIKHGLRPLGSGGVLSIDIRLDGEAIVYSVADNGIGRDRAAAARNGTHRSYGLDITRERLDVFSRLSRQCYKLEIIDLTGEEGSPLGTRVEVRIPIALHLHQSEPERIAP
jgi:LytS/YehU family sensor histidine kinase